MTATTTDRARAAQLHEEDALPAAEGENAVHDR
jgi:hypothetical protein